MRRRIGFLDDLRCSAQAHLANAGVGRGDLFLFFGWFRRVEETGSGYRFVPGAPDLHVLFGWLQVARVIPVEELDLDIPAWAAYHPHFHGDAEGKNTVYVAGDDLQLPGMPAGAEGAGAFGRYREELRLTAPGHTRTRWRLPRWFFSGDDRPPLTYHGNRDRWSLTTDHALLRSVPRGQEFVLDVDHYPEGGAWAYELVSDAG